MTGDYLMLRRDQFKLIAALQSGKRTNNAHRAQCLRTADCALRLTASHLGVFCVCVVQ